MITLEHLADGSISDRNFLKLMRLVIDTGEVTVGVRWGVATLTYSASTNSTGTAVAHGLGRPPSVVVATSLSAVAFGKIPNCTTTGYTDTQFTLNGELKTAHTGDTTVCWVAIG